MKKCTKCLLSKPLTRFGKSYERPDSLRSICKDCKNLENRLWFKQHPEARDKYRHPDWATRQRQKMQPLPLKRYVNKIIQRSVKIARKAGIVYAKSFIKNTRQNLQQRLLVTPLHCPYTNEVLIVGINLHLDHKIPLNQRPDLALAVDNLQFVSAVYNHAKHDMTDEEFNQKYILKARSPN